MNMKESMIERVAQAARVLAENGQTENGQSFRGFRQNAEQLTDRLIAAMFPPYAAASLSRESALLEASELLTACLVVLAVVVVTLELHYGSTVNLDSALVSLGNDLLVNLLYLVGL